MELFKSVLRLFSNTHLVSNVLDEPTFTQIIYKVPSFLFRPSEPFPLPSFSPTVYYDSSGLDLTIGDSLSVPPLLIAPRNVSSSVLTPDP